MRIAYCVLRIAYCVLRGTLVGAVGGWGCGVWTAADFEDLVHFVDEELEFVVGEVAVHVEFLDLGGGAGGFLTVPSEVDDFANETSKDVEEPGVFQGVFAELLLERLGGKVAKEFVILAGDDLEGGLGETGSVISGDQVESGFAVGLESGQTLLLSEVAPVAGVFPVGNVHFGVGVGELRVRGGLEFGNNFPGGDTILDQGVDQVAEWFGEFGDLAVKRGGRLGLWAVGRRKRVSSRISAATGESKDGEFGGGMGLGFGRHKKKSFRNL